MSTRIRQFTPHPCSRCGETITNNRSEFCDECWPEYMKLRDLYRVSRRHELLERNCTLCGKKFWTRRTGRYYCSDECQESVEREANRLRSIRYRSERSDEDKQKVSDYQREYRETHAEEIREGNRSWKAARKEERHRTKAAERQGRIVDMLGGKDVYRPMKYRTVPDPCSGIVRVGRYTFLCLRCGNAFKEADTSQAVSNANSGRNVCPRCSETPLGVSHTSMVELELSRLYPNFTEKAYRPEWMEGMELDLYDPVNRLAVEFHGIVWHSNLREGTRNERLCARKADLCERNGVQLLQVYQTEWEQHRDIVLDRLDSILHRCNERRFARKLEIREMNDTKSRAELNRFMEANHIQGPAPSQWAVALFDGENMVAACTFKYGTGYASGGLAEGTGKYWELNRYATKLHTSVVGGISRCVKAFARTHADVKNIVSFADRRWTCPSRSAYTSSGFVETARVEPNYLYTDLKSSHPLMNKQYMRKSSIERRAKANPEGPEASVFSWDKTETEMATELGFYKVYDAGKIRYEMKL